MIVKTVWVTLKKEWAQLSLSAIPQYQGAKLTDGKMIGGIGRLTDYLITSLQKYYGDAIRRNKGDLAGMMKSVQATLLHCNSTDDTPRHHLCLQDEDSWCKSQKLKALGLEYHHKDLVPEAIGNIIKPIYAHLGSKSLLEKCTGGYTQNANESLHNLVRKFCPKALFQAMCVCVCVDLACELAVCSFNGGVSSLAPLASSLKLNPSPV